MSSTSRITQQEVINAQSLFTVGVHEILSWLSPQADKSYMKDEAINVSRQQKRDYIAASMTCHSWYQAALTQTVRGWSYRLIEGDRDSVVSTRNFSQPQPILSRHLTSLRVHSNVTPFPLNRLLSRYPSLTELLLFHKPPADIVPATTSQDQVAITELSTVSQDYDAEATEIHSNLRRLIVNLGEHNRNQQRTHLPEFNRLIGQFARCTQVTTLFLEDLPFSVDLSGLIHCQQVTTLYLGYKSYPGDAFPVWPPVEVELTNEGKQELALARQQFRVISQLSQLREWRLEDGNFGRLIRGILSSSDKDNSPLVFPQVHDLQANIETIGPGFCSILHSLFPSLTKLNMSECPATEFAGLLKFRQVESLWIGFSQPHQSREVMLPIVAQCHSLTKLTIRCLMFLLTTDEWEMLLTSLPQLTHYEFCSLTRGPSPLRDLVSSPSALALGNKQIRHLSILFPGDEENLQLILADLLHMTACESLTFAVDSRFDEVVKMYFNHPTRMPNLKFFDMMMPSGDFTWDKEKGMNVDQYRISNALATPPLPTALDAE